MKRSIVVAAMLLGMDVTAFAQPPTQDRPPGKIAVARRFTGAAPSLDGKLDDEAWRTASFVTDFVQYAPNNGEAPSESTKVAFLYEDDYLYVGARMFSAHPEHIRRWMRRRDDIEGVEAFIVSLDSYHDRTPAFNFGVTAGGVQYDSYTPDEPDNNRDLTYDPVWIAAVALDTNSWTAELAIPFSQLRFSNLESQTWGLNLKRAIPASSGEAEFWIYIPTGTAGWVSHFGSLTHWLGASPCRAWDGAVAVRVARRPLQPRVRPSESLRREKIF